MPGQTRVRPLCDDPLLGGSVRPETTKSVQIYVSNNLKKDHLLRTNLSARLSAIWKFFKYIPILDFYENFFHNIKGMIVIFQNQLIKAIQVLKFTMRRAILAACASTMRWVLLTRPAKMAAVTVCSIARGMLTWGSSSSNICISFFINFR